MFGLAHAKLFLRSLLSKARPGTFSGFYSLVPTGRDQFLYVPSPKNPLSFRRADGRLYVLAKQFSTDLASTPRAIWFIPGFAPQDMLPSAVVHDWIYQAHHDGNTTTTFEDANLMLEEMCLTQTDPPYSGCEAFAIREACNLFGRSIWDGGRSATK